MMLNDYNLDNGLHVSIKEMIISSVQLDEEFKKGTLQARVQSSFLLKY